MQAPLPLEYISQLIEGGYYVDARSGLASILEADPAHAAAWALAAWVAPDAERCVQALQKVVEHSQDARLTQWAKRGLLQIEHTGALGEDAPPVLSHSRAAPAPYFSVAMPVREPKAPKERGAGYNLSQIGGGVMLGGTVILALAIFFKPFADFMANVGFGPGTCGLGLLAIGAVVAYVGYQRSKAS